MLSPIFFQSLLPNRLQESQFSLTHKLIPHYIFFKLQIQLPVFTSSKIRFFPRLAMRFPVKGPTDTLHRLSSQLPKLCATPADYLFPTLLSGPRHPEKPLSISTRNSLAKQRIS